MKKCIKTVVLLITAALMIPLSVEASRGLKTSYLSPSGKTVTGKNWLFVIGINNYQIWPKLNTAVNDAKSLKNVLLDRYYFDTTTIIELYNDNATRKNIIGELRSLATKIQKEDSLVIFYAGHGHIDSITKEGSWIPVNSEMDNSASWISNHDIKQYLNIDAIKAKHILLVSDSCFSGDFFRGKRGKLPEVTPAAIKKAYTLTSRQAITSGGIEPVSDAGFGNNSVFSHFFIKTLKENSSPFVTPSELFPDIKAGVAENAEQFPQFGSLKGTGGQQGGEFVFILKQEAQLKDLSAMSASKAKELERLKELEKAERLAKERENAEIAKRKKEIAELDTAISAMKQRLGTSAEQTNDSLRAMLELVRKKKAQKKTLDALKQKKTDEAAKRQLEIRRLRKKTAETERLELKNDIRDYTEIVSSDYGKDMADSAWQFLVNKYPVRADGVKKGDVNTLASPGWLSLRTIPSNVSISLETIDTHYRKGMPLDPGTYSVTVSAEGYFPKAISVSIKAGQTTRTTVRLDRGFINSIGMTFAYIKPGDFKMGSKKANYEERPVHKVTLSRGFYMQTTEITQKQWWEVMRTTPSYYNKGRDNCPVDNVSWEDANEFIQRLNKKEGKSVYRLPTEAEWEYACRAGSSTPYANGNSPDDMAWYKMNSGRKPNPVAQKKPNSWGLYDMHGNVSEWCYDWYDDYTKNSLTDPTGPSTGANRVLRGGSADSDASRCISASRDYGNPERGGDCQGFRVLMTTSDN